MMKRFAFRELKEAVAFSVAGGQALHVHGLAKNWPGAPSCFRRSKLAAHLFDQDAERLLLTGSRLGVRVLVIHRRGTDKQHIDLCGQPLERAMAWVKADEGVKV